MFTHQYTRCLWIILLVIYRSARSYASVNYYNCMNEALNTKVSTLELEESYKRLGYMLVITEMYIFGWLAFCLWNLH